VRVPWATRLVLIIKGNKRDAEWVREQCRNFLEGKLKLILNMEKTKITHVNDGFVFLGHRGELSVRLCDKALLIL